MTIFKKNNIFSKELLCSYLVARLYFGRLLTKLVLFGQTLAIFFTERLATLVAAVVRVRDLRSVSHNRGQCYDNQLFSAILTNFLQTIAYFL
jgi:hypothetical protein